MADSYSPEDIADIDRVQADAREAFRHMVATYRHIAAGPFGELAAYVAVGNIIDTYPETLTPYVAYAVKVLAERSDYP